MTVSVWAVNECEYNSNKILEPTPGEAIHAPVIIAAATLRKLLDGVWEGEKGELYRMVCDGKLCWTCKREVDNKSFKVSHDPKSGLVWWGIQKRFFFDPRDIVANPTSVSWYAAGDVQKTEVCFVWRDFKKTVSKQKSALSKVKTPSDASSDVSSGETTVGDVSSGDESWETEQTITGEKNDNISDTDMVSDLLSGHKMTAFSPPDTTTKLNPEAKVFKPLPFIHMTRLAARWHLWHEAATYQALQVAAMAVSGNGVTQQKDRMLKAKMLEAAKKNQQMRKFQ